MGKSDNFSEWYNDIVEKADLIDKRYPIKGLDVWRPYGLAAMRAIDRFIHEEMQRTKHDEVEFPLFIPKTEFQKEADQIKGFGSEVYWVTHGGDNELDIPLVVRPTSETAMYPMFALWVRSHKDLPLKIYQIVNVFRYETKQTRSFMRVRQIHFFEAHTAHVDYEDAERQIHEDLEIWARLAEKLCLPYMLNRRPEWDKFPGAFYSIGADALLPERKTLQIATFHHYKDNFAKPYDIKYESESGEHVFAHQTTYGMSERLLGAIISVHGDDKGLMLPPGVAPIQAVIVPILFKGKEAGVVEAAREVAATLSGAGIRVHVDDREETAGFKYNDWEMKGVPLRVEIGPRDVDKKQAVVVRRDSGEKAFVAWADLPSRIPSLLGDVAEGMTRRARQLLEENVKQAGDALEARDHVGVARVGWCGAEACGEAIEETSGKTVLGVPVDVAFGAAFAEDARSTLVLPNRGYKGACAHCGKPTETPVYVSKTY
ncbi:MAG TPA: proline--tRNA ligase [Candidatus Thermoplasmatota archaeon]|nr:proline--tRNA ligase [Candidatus Thermoplasmatota archaeon]